MERPAPRTAEDFRAELARQRLPIYVLAARVPMHPVRLSKVLNGRIPLRPEIAEKIARAIRAASGSTGPEAA